MTRKQGTESARSLNPVVSLATTEPELWPDDSIPAGAARASLSGNSHNSTGHDAQTAGVHEALPFSGRFGYPLIDPS